MIFAGDIERARLKRELSSFKVSDREKMRIYKNGSIYSELTLEEKYKLYKLSFLSPTDDNELYFVLKTLLGIDWDASEYQLEIEENMVEEIISEQVAFYGDNPDKIGVTAGDIVIYFGKRLGYETETSVAKSCEILLGNIGLVLPVQKEDSIEEIWRYFEKSDENPDCLCMFDPEYYNWNSSYYNGRTGRYLVPDWWEQFQVYLGILVPES